MHYLSIGAIFRSENSWLEEWVDYHRDRGAEHFYLFNDDPDTHVSDRILQPHITTGLVENHYVKDWKSLTGAAQHRRQVEAYREIIKMSKGRTFWLALIDLDEFLLPRQTDDLRVFMQDYEQSSGLAVNWSIFGTGGHVKRPPTQIDHLLYRAETLWEPNSYIKSIIKPEEIALERMKDSHYFDTINGNTVNENHEPVRWLRYPISTEKIRLNHYVLRSLQDFWEVKTKRERRNAGIPCDENYFTKHDRNEVFDNEISRRFSCRKPNT